VVTQVTPSWAHCHAVMSMVIHDVKHTQNVYKCFTTTTRCYHSHCSDRLPSTTKDGDTIY